MRSLLFSLVSFIAITSTLSGLLMVSRPDGQILGLSPDLLDKTPFRNFMLPGILLTATVGIVNLLAVFFNLERHPKRYNWAMAGGITVSGWIIMQTILVQAIHWFQFLYLITGILIVLIAYQLKGKWAA